MGEGEPARLARLAAGEPSRVFGERLHLEAVHADGHEFPIELTLTATDGPTGPIFHAFCHDVTAERRISRFADVEATTSRGLAQAPSSHIAAARVVEALGVKMDWQVAELWLTDDDWQVVLLAPPGTPLQAAGWAVSPLDELEPGVGLPGRLLHR